MMSWICRLEGCMYCPMRSSLMVTTLSHVSSSRPTARTTPASSASGSPVTRPLPGGFHFHMNSRSPYEHSNTSPTHTHPLSSSIFGATHSLSVYALRNALDNTSQTYPSIDTYCTPHLSLTPTDWRPVLLRLGD